MSLNHRERIERAISLQEVDRLPWSMWKHCHNIDRFPRKLAEYTLQMQRELDLDFVKFIPYGQVQCVDWGLDLRQSQSDFEQPRIVGPIITKLSDWDKIVPRHGNEGEYAVILESQRIVMESLPKDVPFIVTIFSPITIAAWMTDNTTLLTHLRTHPDKVEHAFEIIMETLIEYVEAAVRLGASGYFLAARNSQVDLLSREEHAKFIMKYDMEMISRLKGKTWLNVVHIHGAHTWREDIVKNYDVPIFNWHDRDDGPNFDEARALTPNKCFWGGLSHLKTLHMGTDEDVRAQVEDTWRHNNGKGVILGPGCVVNARTSMERLKFVADCVKSTAKE